MTRRWNGKTLREILAISSLAEFYDWVPPNLTDSLSCFALATFGLFPVVIALRTLSHLSFDQMITDSMGLLDGFLFPLVALFSVAAYSLTAGKLWNEKRPLKNNAPLKLFFALLLWMCGNVLFVNGVTDSVWFGDGLQHESFLLHIEYFLSFLMMGVFLREQRLKLWLLRGLTAVSLFLVPCAFYLWRNLQASPVYYDWRPSVACIWSNPNYYGYFLTVFVSLSAALFAGAESRGWRAFYAAALVANSVTLCYNDTLGAWIGALCGCLFVVAAYRLRDGRWNRWSLAALGLFLLSMCAVGLANGRLFANVSGLSRDVGLVLTQPDSAAAQGTGSGRWIIWRRCVELIRQYPLFGIGFEGVYVRNLREFMGAHYRPHNEYMQYALFYGIPGGALYLAGCASIYIRALRRRAVLDNVTLAALTAAFGYLCGAFFGLTVYNTAPYLFIMLGLGYVQAAETTETVESTEATD